MIKVARNNYKNGTYECRYLNDGKEIAVYRSKDDVLYLRTKYIGCDFKRSVYGRALTCKMSEAYRYLFEMLNADEKTSMSEYDNL